MYGKRPIDLIQEGPKYDVLLELVTNNMKAVKDPSVKSSKGKQKAELGAIIKKRQSGLLKLLEIVDLKITPEHRYLVEMIEELYENYNSSSQSDDEDWTYNLLSFNVSNCIRDSAGNSYFHL